MIDNFERGAKLAGRYLLKGRVESGGMGEVYVARDEVLGRDVAIKRVKVDSDISAEQMPMFMRRFRHEAMAVAKLRHPNIVTVHDVQQAGDSPFIVMEYFRGGQPLVKWGSQAKPSIAQWLRISKMLFSALHHAHSRGLLHRDIKSGNVLARGSADEDDVEILLIDWGIALMEGATRLTQHNGVIGTPGAIDPAVIKGGSWSHQSDFYALGALLYQCFCGAKPHNVPKDTPTLNLNVIYAENKIIPPYKANPAIDGDLQTFLIRLLHTDPAERPPSARAAIAIIEALERGEDVDLAGIAAKYPTTPQVLDDDELEEIDRTSPDAPRKPGTVPLGRDPSIAGDVLAEFDERPSGTAATKPERAPTSNARSGKLSGLNAIEAQGLAGLDEAGVNGDAASAGNPLDARLGSFRGEDPAAAPTRSRTPKYAAAAVVVAVLIGVLAMRRSTPREAAATTPAPVAIEAVDPNELQRREQEPAALDKLAAEKKAPSEAPPSKYDPNTRAEYETNDDHIGGTVPPTPAALRGQGGGGSSSRREKETPKIDRSMQPAGMNTDLAKGKSEPLPVRYGTRVEVKLLEALDTSSGEPVKAKLLKSLAVDETRAIPAGAIFYGKASLRVTGGVPRSQVHFDHVLYPSGEEQRIAAVSIKSDGSEGLAVGEFEYGDPEADSDTAGKAGNLLKDAALEGLSALPGGNTASGSLRAVADETSDAISKGKQRPRRKTRMLVPKDAILNVRFQPLTIGR